MVLLFPLEYLTCQEKSTVLIRWKSQKLHSGEFGHLDDHLAQSCHIKYPVVNSELFAWVSYLFACAELLSSHPVCSNYSSAWFASQHNAEYQSALIPTGLPRRSVTGWLATTPSRYTSGHPSPNDPSSGIEYCIWCQVEALWNLLHHRDIARKIPNSAWLQVGQVSIHQASILCRTVLHRHQETYSESSRSDNNDQKVCSNPFARSNRCVVSIISNAIEGIAPQSLNQG